MPIRIARIVAIAVATLVLAGAFAWQYGLFDPAAGRPGSSGLARIGGPFRLIDQNGQVRTDKDFRGKLMLVYFGYTFCPDACPTALQLMTVALKELGKDADQVQPIFITIDPARDTQARMADYVKNFSPRLIGLTGSPEAIAKAAHGYRVYYAKAQIPGQKDDASSSDYLMDHSSIIYLMDREGRYITHFTHNSKPQDIANQIGKNL